MDIKDYEFHIGDEVITTQGAKGEITYICNCKYCGERGFYELFWVDKNTQRENCISVYDATDGFNSFYKIGKYRFNDFDKSDVLRLIELCEGHLKQLKNQLKIIEELENIVNK